MRKIYIKTPDIKSKRFRMKRKGWKWTGFRSAAGAIGNLERRLGARKGGSLKEKTAIVIKRYDGSSWVDENETLDSRDPKYLVYTTACFLEEYLSNKVMRRILRGYSPEA